MDLRVGWVCNMGLFDTSARQICVTARVENGSYTADQLTYFVKQWPKPTKALEYMHMGFDKVPIVFLDVPFDHMARWMMELLRERQAVWPIGLMPLKHLTDWHEDAQARMLAAYLDSEGLGVQMVTDDDAVLCRGEWVRPCDLRLTFKRGYTYA